MTQTALPMEVDVHSVKRMLDQGDDFLLLDCRETEEYSIVHIPAAVLIPMSELMARVGELEPHRGRPMVVHCHHGGRSLQVAMWLRRQDFQQVQSMAGGIDEWSMNIDPSLPRY